ncbi:MAG: hypothetical protein IPF64_00420 [Flavobacteriales bacterium]|nr:hypothetical protein [Flavobacteriales bacterium]
MLLTDADCLPAGTDWISTMAAGFSKGKQIVIGHSPYAYESGLTNLLERYDGTMKAMQYMSFAQAGFPYMGVGRNLGYTGELFFNAKGPRRYEHLMSGDDDLFINQVARAKNTGVVADPRAFMTTQPTPDGYLAASQAQALYHGGALPARASGPADGAPARAYRFLGHAVVVRDAGTMAGSIRGPWS